MDQHSSVDSAGFDTSMPNAIRHGKWKAARDIANRVASSGEDDLRAWAQAGRVLEVCGAWDEAADHYRKFAARFPPLFYPRYRLCHVLARCGASATRELAHVLSGLEAGASPGGRVGALTAMLGAPEPDAIPPTVARGLWRRWFRGKAQWHEGSATARRDMAVVVIGFRAQPGLRDAVRSLLAQDAAAEIVVVNSGGGETRELLAENCQFLRIIDIDEPLYVGAARNVGIDASEAPYVGFLAGDCVVRPGWISKRLAAHRRGARAVASAMVPAESGGNLALATHVALFGARSPEVPPLQALRYGASYERQVFREFGYFNPALRISEDTDFARRTARSIHPAWDPSIQTEHGNPAGLWRFVLDMYGRGKRVALQQPGAAASALTSMQRVLEATKQRNAIATRIARDMLGIKPGRLRRMGRRLWPANLAYGLGALAGAREQARAAREHERSLALQDRPAEALRHAKEAARRSPQNAGFQLDAARHCLGLAGEEGQAGLLLDAAERLAGYRENSLLATADWLVASGLHERAWLLGDRTTIDLPRVSSVHRRLALAALETGDLGAFELAALDALARNPDDAELWSRFLSVFPRLDQP